MISDKKIIGGLLWNRKSVNVKKIFFREFSPEILLENILGFMHIILYIKEFFLQME